MSDESFLFSDWSDGGFGGWACGFMVWVSNGLLPVLSEKSFLLSVCKVCLGAGAFRDLRLFFL